MDESNQINATKTMARVTKFTFTVILFLLLNVSQAGLEFNRQNINLKGEIFDLEIADTPLHQRQGLMFRTSIGEQQGMLFVYGNEGRRGIWMKNTLIPLAVFWLDASSRIVYKQILQPCMTPRCPVYQPVTPAQFVLELHPNQFDNFNVGDSLPGLLLFRLR